MDLILHNRIIEEPIENILKKVQQDTNYKHIRYVGHPKGNNIPVSCPFHKDGQEQHPSCYVYAETDSDAIPYGFYKCFTCGAQGSLSKLIGKCFDEDSIFGENWLLEHYGNMFLEKEDILLPINLDNKPNKKQVLSNDILLKYRYKHPYMYQRKLTDEVIEKFQVGYDLENDCLTFPVWDEHNNLVTITRRSTSGKKFILESDIEKPVYLLNFIIRENITSVYVVESQINCLTLWTWGYPAIALFGTGSQKQYEVLNRSGIRNYTLCFDGDNAGDKGKQRFLVNISKDVLVQSKIIPRGKDVNDLSKEEFDKIPIE